MGIGTLAAFAAGVAIFVVGCGSSSTAATVAEKQAFEKKTGGSEAKAAAFVKQLESMPADQRQAYMKQHPDDVRNMAMILDPDVQMKFRKIVENRE